MLQTLFVDYVKKYFASLAKTFTQKINDKKEEPTYLHKSMLRKEFSTDLKWDSTSVNSSIVAADVVAMDSPLPLKKRDSFSKASGDLPKIGMKLFKGEKLISDVNIMVAKGTAEAQIVQKIFEDLPRCQKGVYEQLEFCFLQGLSDGVTLVPEEGNTGIGIRVDYGYKEENKFGVSKKWGTTGYTPLSDIANTVLEKVAEDGNTISVVAIGKNAYENFRKSDEAKMLAANYNNFIITDKTLLPIPTKATFDAAIEAEYGFRFMVIDRNVMFEKNGIRTSKKPFDANKLIFLTSTEVGRLVYGTLAEETNPVAGVQYQKADGFILLSKFSKNDPLREFTSSQAIALPVIDNVDSIYVMDTQEAVEVDAGETEGDTKITIWGLDYLKSEVIEGLATIGVTVAANATDASVINTINTLSDKKEATLKAALVPYPKATPTTLTFTKDANTIGKVITVSTTGTVTAESNQSWCTVTVASNKVTAKVEANAGEARTATITVTQNSKSVTIAVTQAAGS